MAKTGTVVAVAAIGGLMAWSGVSNAGILTSVRDIIQGNPPTAGPVQITSTGGGSVDNAEGSVSDGNGTQQAIVSYAVAQVGKPYVYGGDGPNPPPGINPEPGYDCSGLIYMAYRSVGITIPRTTFVQIVSGTGVPIADAQPGDLLFPEPGHVFMNIGLGQCVEARHTGTTIWTRAYSNSELIAVRRFL